MTNDKKSGKPALCTSTQLEEVHEKNQQILNYVLNDNDPHALLRELYNDCRRIGISQRVAVRDMLVEANIQPTKRHANVVLIRRNKAKTTKRQRRKQKHHEDSNAMLRGAPKAHDIIKQNKKISREVNRRERIARIERDLQVKESKKGREKKKLLEDDRRLARQKRRERESIRRQTKVLNDLMDELNDGYCQIAISVSPELIINLTKMREKLEAEEKRNNGPLQNFLSGQYGKDPSKSFLPGYCFIGVIVFGSLLANTLFDSPPPSKRQILQCGRRFRRQQKNICTSGTNCRKKDVSSNRRYKVASGSRRSRNRMQQQVPRRMRPQLRREQKRISDSLHGELDRIGAFADSKVRAKYDTVTSKNELC